MGNSPPWIYDERIAIVLGFLTLALALAVFLSCRLSLGVLNARRRSIAGSTAYIRFSRYHGSYWWAFIIVFTIHVMTAIGHTGLPAFGDPDAPMHLAILLTGLAAITAMALTFSSCRCAGDIARYFVSPEAMQSKSYAAFYRRHNLFWLLFLLFFIVHLTLAIIHAGIWPPLPS